MKAKLLFLHLGILALFVSLFTSGGGLVVAQSDPFNVGPVRYGDFKVTGSQTIDGTLGLAGGSEAAPSLSFTTDTNTGIFSPGNGLMSFVSNGSTKLEMTSSSVLGREVQIGNTVSDGWDSTSYVATISNADVTSNQGNGLLVQGGAGSSGSNIARFNNSAGTRVFSVGGAGTVSVSSSGNLNVADAGANGGNVPHDCSIVSSAISASTTRTVDCAATEIAVGGGCENTDLASTSSLVSSGPSDSNTWACRWAASSGTKQAHAICCAY
jgi:hypothetical protein